MGTYAKFVKTDKRKHTNLQQTRRKERLFGDISENDYFCNPKPNKIKQTYGSTRIRKNDT